ncbi:MAG: hypothetical protein V7703_07490 [Hyphomicrobiales bacterium]
MSKVQSHEELVQRALRKVAGESAFSTPPKVPPKLGTKYLKDLDNAKADHSRLLSHLTTDLEALEPPVLSAIIAGQGVLKRDRYGSTTFVIGSSQPSFALNNGPTERVDLSPRRTKPLVEDPDFTLKNYVADLSGYLQAGLGLYNYFADYGYYSKFPKFSAYEISWLSLGLNPRSSLVGENYRPHSEFKYQDIEYKESVDKVQELFDRIFGLETIFGAENCMQLIEGLDWAEFDEHPEFRRILKSMSRKKLNPPRKGGRPPKYDWPAFEQELDNIEKHGGLPGTQSDLVEKMLIWFGEHHYKDQIENGGPMKGEPALVTVKKKISERYRRIKKGNN